MAIDGETSALLPSSFALSTSPGTNMTFELPRYGLEFELVGNSLLSLDYRGYRLAKEQQLTSPVVQGYTLPGFQHYLILEKVPDTVGPAVAMGAGKMDEIDFMATTRLVLIPAGQVTHHNDAKDAGKPCVFIELSSYSGEHLEVSLKESLFSFFPTGNVVHV